MAPPQHHLPDAPTMLTAHYPEQPANIKNRLHIVDNTGQERFQVLLLPDGALRFFFPKNVVMALGDSNTFVIKDRFLA